MIAIIDYGSGNVQAIKNIFDSKQIPCILESDPSKCFNIDRYVLAGVGSYDLTMDMLERRGWIDFLNDEVLIKKKPILGICVGMQIMGDFSEEGEKQGLGWISGEVKKLLIPKDERPFLPHMGWNKVNAVKSTTISNLKDISSNFYFLHSYYFVPKNSENTWLETDYHGIFSSGINSENIYGVQFHPEKSHDSGIELLCSFGGK